MSPAPSFSTLYFPGATNTASQGDNPSVLTLSQPKPALWVVAFTGAETPDNRLTPYLLKAYLEALDYVQDQWNTILNDDEAVAQGAALITTGQVDSGAKFFSNGLDLAQAMSQPGFFDYPFSAVFQRLLTYPIPTIASIGGHAFAGAVSLALAHDYRVMNGRRGYLSMNEIFFGAPIPAGMSAVAKAKIADARLRRSLFLEGHRFDGPEALKTGLVDAIVPAPGSPEIPADQAKHFDAVLPQKVLEASIGLATKVRKLASKNAWGVNKSINYVEALEQIAMGQDTFAARADELSEPDAIKPKL